MDGAIYAARVDDIEYIKFFGTVRYSHCAGFESHIDEIFKKQDFEEIVVDLDQAEILDSTALGLLARVAIELKKNSPMPPVIFVKKGELLNILKRVCFDQVFKIISDDKLDNNGEYEELVSAQQDEKQTLERVIKAHEYLAEVDQKNEKLLKDITRSIKN